MRIIIAGARNAVDESIGSIATITVQSCWSSSQVNNYICISIVVHIKQIIVHLCSVGERIFFKKKKKKQSPIENVKTTHENITGNPMTPKAVLQRCVRRPNRATITQNFTRGLSRTIVLLLRCSLNLRVTICKKKKLRTKRN